MAVTKKHVKLGKLATFDTKTLNAKVMALQHSIDLLDMKKLLSYELVPYPTAMFDDKGLTETKTNSALINAVQAEVSKKMLR